MQGFYLNLASRPDRNVRMLERLGKTSHQITRFEATGSINPPDVFQRKERGPQRLSRYGCLLSHMSMIREAKHRNLPEVILFEDDIDLCDDFDERLQLFLSMAPQNWMILYLGFFPWKDPIPVTPSGLHKVSKSYGTFAYIVRHTAYDRILNLRHYAAIDVLIANHVQALGRCYTFIPVLVKVENDFSDINGQYRVLDNVNKYYSKKLDKVSNKV